MVAVSKTPISPFIAAARGQEPSHTPVWFMRQAGRSLPEYRALRGQGSILDAIAIPEIAAEATLQPVRRYGVDAAILFSDIVVPVHAIGFGIDVIPGRGPVAEVPFSSRAHLSRLRPLEPEEDLPYVLETVSQVAKELNPLTTTLIGFAGAPFTVASYLVEGGPSRTFTKVKALMYRDPELWGQLSNALADMSISFMRAQVEHGAQALQLFDSWAGALSPAEYEQFALPYAKRVMAELADLDVPRIIFGVGTGELLPLMSTSGADIVGVDWRVPLDVATRRIGNLPLQGNLDPALCFAPRAALEEGARDVLRRGSHAPGHIFNLGHGVLPETDPDMLKIVVDLVHEEGRDLAQEELQ
jgi:uroporphyrinogen decarboxylase